MTSVPNVPLEVMKMQWESLRREVEFLKGCQLRYFLFSVTSVVGFIGFLRVDQSSFRQIERAFPWIFLTPLLIVIPCWLIYFDKAKSIVGSSAFLRCWMI
jgi:hypothetical protein